jgi:HEAT repeat protein
VFLNRLAAVTHPDERSAVAVALGGLPPPAVEIVPALVNALVNALDTDHDLLRRTIPMALEKLGPLARSALPALAQAACRDFADPRGSSLDAASAIATIGPDSEEGQALLEPLVALLRQPKFEYQLHVAASILQKYGPDAAAAVHFLEDALQSDFAGVRQHAASLLGRIGPAALPASTRLSTLSRTDPHPGVRQAAADALRRIAVE